MKLICEHQPGWLNELECEVASLNAAQPHLNMIALVDCAFNAQCHAAIRRYPLPFRTLYDLSANPSPELQAVSPTLVPLTAATTAAWQEILRLTDGFPMLSLIITPEALDELAGRFEPWCIVNADGQPFVFRFPDTRRLPAVIDVLSPDQHGALCGPAVAWRYRTRAAQWDELPMPKAPGAVAEAVKLNAEQYLRLMRDCEADVMIAKLSLLEPALMHSHTAVTAHALVATGLQRADHYGIEGEDRAHWCSIAMQRPQLEQLSQAVELLVTVQRKERPYADIRNDLSQLARA